MSDAVHLRSLSDFTLMHSDYLHERPFQQSQFRVVEFRHTTYHEWIPVAQVFSINNNAGRFHIHDNSLTPHRHRYLDEIFMYRWVLDTDLCEVGLRTTAIRSVYHTFPPIDVMTTFHWLNLTYPRSATLIKMSYSSSRLCVKIFERTLDRILNEL